MSDADDILAIFKHIKTQLAVNKECFDLLSKIFTARAEAEEKYAQTLKQIADDKTLSSEDPLVLICATSLRKEAENRLTTATNLRQNVVKKFQT